MKNDPSAQTKPDAESMLRASVFHTQEHGLGFIDRAMQVAYQLKPRLMLSVLTSSIANLVGTMHDDAWEALKAEAATPCASPDCSCHKFAPKMLADLEAIRAEHRRKILEGMTPEERAVFERPAAQTERTTFRVPPGGKVH